MAKIKRRVFKILDIDCEVIVEVVSSQKEIFSFMDEYIDNLPYDWFEPTDDSFEILYRDGSCDYVASDYDGHKIRKKNIASIVYDNACTSIVYGGFTINEYGVVTASEMVNISEYNVKEVTT